MLKIFIIPDKQFLIYSMVIQELDLKPFTNKTDKTEETGLKILTVKEMLQRFPIVLAQVKAGNNSESLLNEIR